MDNLRVPDAVGTVQGYRLWWVDLSELRANQPLLRSTGRRERAWRIGGIEQAECIRRDQVTKGVRLVSSTPLPGCGGPWPSISCTCGIYANSSAAHLASAVPVPMWTSPEGVFVLGKIEGWGRVVEHDQGWRLEYARPIALLDFPSEVVIERARELLSDRYEIPVVRDPGLPRSVLCVGWGPQTKRWLRGKQEGDMRRFRRHGSGSHRRG